MNKVVKIILVVIVFLSDYSLVFSQAVMWQRVYDYNGKQTAGRDVIQTFDGGYIVCGTIVNPVRIYLIKLNYFGIVEWENIIRDSSGAFLQALSIKQTFDSSFIMVGKNENNLCLIRTDKTGNFLWKKNFNEFGGEAIGRAIIITSDAGYLACGSIFFPSPASEKTYVIKTDSLGNLQWEKLYSDSVISNGYDILELPDKKYYLAGIASSNFANPYHGFLKRLDNDGNLLWNIRFVVNSSITKLLSLNSKNLVLGGVAYPSGIFISKVDTAGNIIFQKTLSTSNPEFYFSSMCLNTFPRIAVGGKERYPEITGTNDFSACIIDTNGQLLYEKRLNTPKDADDNCYSIKYTSDNGYIFVGDSDFNLNREQKDIILVAKTDSLFITTSVLKIATNISSIENNFTLHQNFPNPFNNSTIIKYQLKKSSHVLLTLYDITGRHVETLINMNQERNTYQMNLNTNNLSSGCYFLRLMADGNLIETKKLYCIK